MGIYVKGRHAGRRGYGDMVIVHGMGNMVHVVD